MKTLAYVAEGVVKPGWRPIRVCADGLGTDVHEMVCQALLTLRILLDVFRNCIIYRVVRPCNRIRQRAFERAAIK